MKKQLIALFFILFISIGYSQEEQRSLLRGKVMYRSSNVQNENVINVNTEMGVITNANGEFAINVKVGDELTFMALNYEIKRVLITPEILQNNRLVVEVTEKVTELDEVVVGPENEAAFIKLKNEEFKAFDYGIDETTRVENIALSQADRGMQNGLNFINIFKAIRKGLSNDESEADATPKLKLSDVLRQVYDDEFFVKDLQLPQDKINEFLFYCDSHMSEQSLLKKTNEFQLIDFLVNESKAFKMTLDDKK